MPSYDDVVPVDDTLRAATAYRLAAAGTALLWRGDYVNARQLLAALDRRVPDSPITEGSSPAEIFHAQRRHRARRAQLLGRLLVELDAEHRLLLRRAPDVRDACHAAYGPPSGPSLVPLRELLGVLGAHQWRIKGIEVPALAARIHPHYAVFAPTRSEYVDLVATTPLPPHCRTAFDLGTGTGVLAAVLARRGVGRVVATDASRRALACAEENVRRLGYGGRVVVRGPGLFPGDPAEPDGLADLAGSTEPYAPAAAGAPTEPDGPAEPGNLTAPGNPAEPGAPTATGDPTEPGGPAEPYALADLVVCNPPWLPALPAAELEMGVYDEGGRMLRAFLAGLRGRLRAGGEGWLVLSDLAELLELRTRRELLGMIAGGGLEVVGKADVRARHRRARDRRDPLHAVRAAEVTSLWRLRATRKQP